MGFMEEFLADYRRETDPKRKWTLLEQAARTAEGAEALAGERLWWTARYAFTDKRKTLVRDNFIWLMLLFAGYNKGGRGTHKELVAAHDNILGASALREAIASDDRLYEQLLEAAAVYVETLRQGPRIFGLALGNPSPEQTRSRVAREVVNNLLLPLSLYGRGLAHNELLMRAVYEATLAAYPGIRQKLEEAVGAIPEEEAQIYIKDVAGI